MSSVSTHSQTERIRLREIGEQFEDVVAILGQPRLDQLDSAGVVWVRQPARCERDRSLCVDPLGTRSLGNSLHHLAWTADGLGVAGTEGNGGARVDRAQNRIATGARIDG